MKADYGPFACVLCVHALPARGCRADQMRDVFGLCVCVNLVHVVYQGVWSWSFVWCRSSVPNESIRKDGRKGGRKEVEGRNIWTRKRVDTEREYGVAQS